MIRDVRFAHMTVFEALTAYESNSSRVIAENARDHPGHRRFGGSLVGSKSFSGVRQSDSTARRTQRINPVAHRDANRTGRNFLAECLGGGRQLFGTLPEMENQNEPKARYSIFMPLWRTTTSTAEICAFSATRSMSSANSGS